MTLTRIHTRIHRTAMRPCSATMTGLLGIALVVGGCGDGAASAGTAGRQLLRAERVSVLADGRILVAGVSERRPAGKGEAGCDGDLAIVRLDAGGRPDAGFGNGGTARIRPDDKGCVSSVNDVVAGSQGQIFAGMTIFYPSDSVLEDNSSQGGELLALRPDGQVDDDFDNELIGFQFAVSPDGSLFDDYGTRYLPDGDRDPRDRQGSVPVSVDHAVDVAAQPDGKKLFLGQQDRVNHRRLAVQRFDAQWQPDAAFGNGGNATADIAPGERLVDNQPELQRVLPAPDGGAIAFGLSSGPTLFHAFAIKFDAAGRLDHRFGKRGRIEIGARSRSKDVYDLAMHPDGSLVAIGSIGSGRSLRLFVARYNADGTPDRRFGRSGSVTIDRSWVPRNVDLRKLNRGNHGAAITAGPGGTTVGVASLRTLDGSAAESLVFRLRPDGTLDPGFGRRGVKRIERLG
jgi:uncharacterized delta-60 repeat protein